MKIIQDLKWYKNKYLSEKWEKKETFHYLFFYFPSSLTDIDSISLAKEKHYQKILSFLGLKNSRKIHYYIYPSVNKKKELMGDNSLGNTIWKSLKDSTPEKFEIHTVYGDEFKFIGEHEDTHLLSLPLGLSIFLFCEGLAQFMEGEFLGEDIDKLCTDFIRQKKIYSVYSIEWLAENKNWKDVDPKIIYPQAGSFARFLINNYSKDKFKQAYVKTSRLKSFSENLKAVEEVFSKSLKDLEKEWMRKLNLNQGCF